MGKEKFSRSEQKTLRQQTRHAILFALGLFSVISVFNVVIFFRDIILGIEGLERPSIGQFMLIQTMGFIIAISVFYFPSKKILKDLSSKFKNSEVLEVGFKFIQNKDGKPVYTLKMKNALIVTVQSEFYKSVQVGNLIEVQYASESLYVFGVKKLENI